MCWKKITNENDESKDRPMQNKKTRQWRHKLEVWIDLDERNWVDTSRDLGT